MKVWSPLLATVLVLAGVSAQFDGDISIEMVADDYSDSDFGVTEARDGPPPCNGFPEYRKIPINQAFYLGAHNAGSHVFNKSCQSSQTKDISTLLHDGVRYLDINLCKDEGKMVICSSYDATPSTLTFTDVLEQIFKFSRDAVEQFMVINIKSENVKQAVSTKELEELIDERCKVHTELTAGTDEFVKTECPFVQTFKGRWPSMGEVVNFDPEMAQWEGDGELVGVRTKFLISLADNVLQTPGYRTSYFSPKFWRSIGDKVETLEEFQKVVGKQCRVPAGGIGLEAYVSTPCSELNEKIFDIDFIEDTLTSRKACNLNDSPLNTFFSFISVDNYEKRLAYLKELEKRMMELNYEKWGGNYKLVTPSLFKSAKKEEAEKHVARDEL